MQANPTYRKPLISLSPSEEKLIKVTGFVLGFSVLGLAGYGLARWAIRKSQGKQEGRQSLDKGDPASYATRLFKAMDGFGVTQEAIRAVFRELKDWQHYEDVSKSYERKYGTLLQVDLEEELDETEFEELMEIVNELKLPKDRITSAHLESWSKRLRKAWDLRCWGFPCTDEDAAYAVLRDVLRSSAPKAALNSLKRHYLNRYQISIQEEAESELSGEDLARWNRLLNQINIQS